MNEKYERNCPLCEKKLNYKSNEAWNLAKRKDSKCRNCSTKTYAKRIGDVSFLLNDENESFYWIGFILADGSISNESRLKITLSRKDKQHLEKFSDRIGVKCSDVISKIGTKEYEQTTMSIMHTEVIKKIIKKFNINKDKTHFPPTLSIFDNFNNEQLFSLFIGFIDGDGSIGKKHLRDDFWLRIQNHSSWILFLKYFNEKLQLNSVIKINNRGYALLQISNYEDCKKIKTKMIDLKIPYLERKWDKIDLSYFGINKLKKNNNNGKNIYVRG